MTAAADPADLDALLTRLAAMPPDKRLRAHQLLAERGIAVDDLGPSRLAGEPAAVTIKQEALWRLHQAGEGDDFYHVGLVFELQPELEESRLRVAYGAVTEQHDVLRTGYRHVAGSVLAAPATPAPTAFDGVCTIRAANRADAVRHARLEARAFGAEPFALDPCPLRTLLIDARPHAYFLVLVSHDIACDRFGLRNVLGPSLAVAYRDTGRGEPKPTRGLRLRDVASWQRDSLSDGVLNQQVRRQVARLRNMVRVPVPVSGPRNGSRLPLPPVSAERAFAYARERGVPTTAVALAAWGSALSSVLGTACVAVGVCAAGRHRPQLRNVLGNLANTMVVPLDASEPDLLGQAGAGLAAALGDADAPFESVISGVGVERLDDPPADHLVQDEWIGARLTMHHPLTEPKPEPLLDLVRAVHDPATGSLAKSALNLELEETAHGFTGRLDYRPAAVPAEVANKLAAAFARALLCFDQHSQL